VKVINIHWASWRNRKVTAYDSYTRPGRIAGQVFLGELDGSFFLHDETDPRYQCFFSFSPLTCGSKKSADALSAIEALIFLSITLFIF